MEDILYDKAAFALLDGIDTPKKLLDVKKQLNHTIMEIQMGKSLEVSMH